MVGGLSVALFCHCQPITQWCVGKEKTVPSSISAAVFFAAESNRCDRLLQVFFVKKGGIRMKILRHKLKPHTLFCIIASVIVLVSYAVFFCIVSKHYTVMLFFSETMNIDSVRIEQSDDKIVAIKDVRREMFLDMIETLSVEVESIHEGDVRLSVFYENTYEGEKTDDTGQTVTEPLVEQSAYEVDLHVTPFGTIYNMTHDSFNGMWTLQLLGCALSIIWIITLGLAFYEKEKNGEFTYSMIIIGGLIFFLSVITIFSLYDIVVGWDYRHFDTIKNVLHSFSQISQSFISVTAIPLLLFCLVLSISNIQLVRHEGFRPQNLLGVLLGLAVFVGVCMLFLSARFYTGSETTQILLTVINTAVAFTFSYLECLLVSTIFCAIASTRYQIKQPMDYIIILGCAIRQDGSPTPILRGRIDRALAFEREQAEKWQHHAKFVPSGGQGSDEVISEAESMKRYLMEQGIPEERILKEDRSVNTYQNMAFSKKVIEDDAGDLAGKAIAFSTTNYHVLRGYTLAQRIGMKVKGLSAKTKLYFFPNAFLREFIGLLFEKKFFHLFVVFVGAAFFASLYFVLVY